MSTLVRAACVPLLCAACSGRQPAPDARAAPPPIAVGHSTPAVAHASSDARSEPAASRDVTGPVLETMDAANYTYVHVGTEAGELWAAASRFPVAVGDRVTISLEQPMENFHSKTLNRDFKLIYFVSQIARAGGTAAGAAPATSPTPAPAAGHIPVADIWKTRATLAGQTVTVRGTVVKFNGGILGVNWIHIQDGTGSDDGSNDITVTSEMPATIGDVVTATGVVALNKNLGSGYNYPVIIENARLAK